jgi:hypothetical protein
VVKFGLSVGSPLSSQAGGIVTTLNFSVGSPLSTLAGGAVRMRRMTFLFNSELSIVLCLNPPVRPRSEEGANHWNRNSGFFQVRITEMLGYVQFDLVIIAIKFIYSTLGD